MTWVLVDVASLAYRAYHTTIGKLSMGDVPTGVLYGFFLELRRACTDPRVGSNKIACFFDSRSSYRRRRFPAYKQKRRENLSEEEIERKRLMRRQLILLRRTILPDIGIPCYLQKGLESDDLIAEAAGEVDRGVILSSDGDLFQCITNRVHWFNPWGGAYYHRENFEKIKGIKPSRWGEVKVLSGCQTDGVPGIPGVGEKTAIQWLRYELPSHHKRFQAIQDEMESDDQNILDRNRELVILPHRKTRPIHLQEPKFDTREFFRMCERFGLRSFLADRAGWFKFFKGETKMKLRRKRS